MNDDDAAKAISAFAKFFGYPEDKVTDEFWHRLEEIVYNRDWYDTGLDRDDMEDAYEIATESIHSQQAVEIEAKFGPFVAEGTLSYLMAYNKVWIAIRKSKWSELADGCGPVQLKAAVDAGIVSKCSHEELSCDVLKVLRGRHVEGSYCECPVEFGVCRECGRRWCQPEHTWHEQMCFERDFVEGMQCHEVLSWRESNEEVIRAYMTICPDCHRDD